MSATVTQFGELHMGGEAAGVGRAEAGCVEEHDGFKAGRGSFGSAAGQEKMSRGALLTNTVFQVAVAALLIALPVFFPQKLATQILYEVTPLAAPDNSIPLPPKQPVLRAKVAPVPEPAPIEQPEPVHVAKLIAPRPLVAPKPKPIQVQNQEAPKVEQALTEAKFEAPVAELRVRASR